MMNKSHWAARLTTYFYTLWYRLGFGQRTIDRSYATLYSIRPRGLFESHRAFMERVRRKVAENTYNLEYGPDYGNRWWEIR